MKAALVYGEGVFATGVKRYAEGLLAELARMGVDAERVALRRREARIRGRVVGGYVSLWAARMGRAPRGYDVVHALDPSVAQRGADVVTVHDLVVEMFPGWYQTTLAARLDQRILRAVARRARRFVADTEATRQEVIARWGVPAERIDVVHLGIDLDRFRPSPENSPLAPPGTPTLAVVGDDNPRKNVGLAVAAVARLRERHGVSARLVRVGASRWPAHAAAWRALAKEKGVDLVEPGSLADDGLVALLSRASALLWPSLAEGFGFPPLEAMACGCPVVALDTPVNREVCGPLARYHPDDPDAAADAVAAALRARPPAADLRAHAGRFTWRATAEATLAAYERAAADRKRI